MIRTRSIFFAALFILLIPLAFARGADQPEESDPLQLESLTVTARKTKAETREVPVSVDVFTDIRLEDAGIEDVSELTAFSPNVHMKHNYTEHVIVIRGIPSFRGSTHSPAGLYVDDVSYPLHYMQNTALFDVERTEILKGPQGTLYDRNTESGVISIITRRPGNEFQGRVFSELADYRSFKAGASISGPLKEDTLFMGGAFQFKQSDGFIENLSNGDDKTADIEKFNGRATLRWTPSDTLDITFTADYLSANDHIGGYRLIDGPLATPRFKVRKDDSEFYDETGSSQVLRLEYKGAALDFLSVTGALSQELDRS